MNPIRLRLLVPVAMAVALPTSALAQHSTMTQAVPRGAVSASHVRAPTSTPVLDSGKRQVRTLAAAAGRRNQAASPQTAAAFAVGAVIGGYAGLYVGARACRCESPSAALAGTLIGGAVGIWVAQKLSHP